MARRLGSVASALALACAPCARADTGTFYSVLAGGQAQSVNAVALGVYEANGQRPASFIDQNPLYTGLIAASPSLTTSSLARYFKAETDGDLGGRAPASVEHPRAGVTIERDLWNVPHVFGATRAGALFGVGYAQAEDRLFFMDLLRHLARGRLSEFVGPGPQDSFLKMDAAQLRVSDYSEPELSRLIDSGVRAARADGPQLRHDLDDFTAGINAYIAQALHDPSKLPAEYPGIAKLPQPWQNNDTAAVATLIAGLEGYGGGREVGAAGVLEAAQARFGLHGRAVFEDFRRRLDPEAPATTTRRFLFGQTGPANPEAIAMPDPGSVRPVGAVVSGTGAARDVTAAGAIAPSMHSSALLIDASRSRSGHPLAVMGPQLGFYSPEALLEMDVHGPGVNVRGVMLPGVFLVIMGRGAGFAWSATTSTTDDTDEFVERLCNRRGGRPSATSESYVYRGRCVPFTKRVQVMTTPGPNGLAPTQTPEKVTFTLLRSVHGPVQAFATVRGRPVAITLARSSYLHDLDGAEAFDELASGRVHDARSFQRAMAKVNLGFNWFYADSKDVSFVQSGWYPRRARGTDPSLPTWGIGRWDWLGFRSSAYTESDLGYDRLPKDTSPPWGYLINWNNDAARGWAAADSEWGYGPVFRSMMFERGVRAALAHGRKLDLAGLVKIMEDVVTADLRGRVIYPLLRRVLGPRIPADLAPAVAALDRWVAAGAHRRDRNGDGFYENAAGVALMDAWWPRLVQGMFQPALGRALVERILSMVPFDRSPSLDYTSYGVGWYGYVDKDIRTELGMSVRGRFSRLYCGTGRTATAARGPALRRCREVLLRTLLQALAAVRAAQGPRMSAWRVPATCHVQTPQACDQIQFVTGGGVDTPPIPWQNRPTYQQAVEVLRP